MHHERKKKSKQRTGCQHPSSAYRVKHCHFVGLRCAKKHNFISNLAVDKFKGSPKTNLCLFAPRGKLRYSNKLQQLAQTMVEMGQTRRFAYFLILHFDLSTNL